jgi:hypothetical protein
MNSPASQRSGRKVLDDAALSARSGLSTDRSDVLEVTRPRTVHGKLLTWAMGAHDGAACSALPDIMDKARDIHMCMHVCMCVCVHINTDIRTHTDIRSFDPTD